MTINQMHALYFDTTSQGNFEFDMESRDIRDCQDEMKIGLAQGLPRQFFKIISRPIADLGI
jgi:hypothetical protein